MTTWIVGDVHGCAEELARLVERLDPGPDDRLLACGDLLHRGPDPLGVCEVLTGAGADFVLGNHEHAVLRRCFLAPRKPDASDRPGFRSEFPALGIHDLAGDGGTPCRAEPEDGPAILRFLQGHAGYFIRGSELEGAGPTPDGRDWFLVHAGVLPGVPLEENTIDTLIRVRYLPLRGRPWWYERYEGPELALFGHTHSTFPRAQRRGDRLVALGLDTGCVYGGKLSAYSPELDELVSVPARRAWASA